MTSLPLKYGTPVTLVGGGVRDRKMLREARLLAPALIAADGAADWLVDLGEIPDAVIGDMDSIRDRSAIPRHSRVVTLAEQDTTDFEKCLYATTAPAYIGVGFTGRRVDHMMTVFNTMLRHPKKPVVLIGEAEVMALAPANKTLTVDVAKGSTVSFVPLMAARGILSDGLRWPVSGLSLAPDGQTGTSNAVVGTRFSVAFDAPGILMMVERRALASLLSAVS